MATLDNTPDALTLTTRMHPVWRGFLVAVSFFPWIAPYELLIRPNWNDYFNVIFLFALLISLGAVSVGLAFLWAGIAGLDVVVRLDKRQRTLSHTESAPIKAPKTVTYPLEAIAGFSIEKHDSTDGEPSYTLHAHLHDGQTLKLAWTYAEDWLRDVQSQLEGVL